MYLVLLKLLAFLAQQNQNMRGLPQKTQTQNWNGLIRVQKKQGIVVQSPDFGIHPKPKDFRMTGD